MQQDIQNGEMSKYLLKPQSYYWHNIVFNEIPYRIIQGFYGIVVMVIIAIVFPGFLNVGQDKTLFTWGVVSSVMGFFICANIEIILGLLAFWFYDMRLIHNAYEVVLIILGGINMPLYLFPHFLEHIAHFTPLPYIIYVPALLFTGQVEVSVISGLLLTQVFWLIATTAMYLIVWRRGIRIYTASGS